MLRLLAVYLGTAAASLWAARRWVSPVRAGVCLFLALAPFLLVGKALLTAGVYAPIDIPYLAPPLAALAPRMGTQVTRTPILADVVLQEVPWRKAVREAVKHGRLPLWNRFVLAGEPLLAVQQPVVLHPATWIGMLLPLAHAWTFEMALRHFLALLCAYLFLRDLSCGELPSLIGAAGWAFSDYLVFFSGYPLSAAAAPFPLLLLGLRRLVRDADRRAAILTTIALLLIVTAGHPESLLHAVAGGGIFFLFELAFAGRGNRRRPLLLALFCGAATLGLCAVLLLPFAEALPQTWEHLFRTSYFAHARKSWPISESARHLLLNIAPYAFGVSGRGDVAEGFAEPAAYAGSLLWPLAAVGLFSAKREKWPFLVFALLGICAGARVAGVADTLGALPLFDIGINERMVFLGTFGLSALAVLGASELAEQRGMTLALGAAVAASLLIVIISLRRQPEISRLAMPADYFRNRILLQTVPLLLAAVVWLPLRRRRFPRGLALASPLLLLLTQRALEAKDFYPTYPSSAFYPPLRSVERVPRNAPQRMAAVGWTLVPNTAALYELEDVRGYEAMTFRPLFETFPLWCVHQPVSFNRVDDPTRPFLAFLNVRYVFAPSGFPPPAGWTVLHRGEEGLLLENPSALPRAFVPRFHRAEPDASHRLRLLTSIQDFARYGIVAESSSPAAPSPSWVSNGQASVRISSYLPERVTFEIQAHEPALVGTSVTAWSGWKLAIDGFPVKPLLYNHAFVGFRVPAGRHTAVLRYWPDGFTTGLAVSGLTAIACLFLVIRSWRNGARPS